MEQPGGLLPDAGLTASALYKLSLRDNLAIESFILCQKHPAAQAIGFFLHNEGFEPFLMEQPGFYKGWHYRVLVYNVSSAHLLGFPSI